MALWWRYGGVMVALWWRYGGVPPPAFLPATLARYFRVGEGHMWENPKLFWARACMGEIFERVEKGLTGIFREIDDKIASNSCQKRWKTLEKR